MLPNYLSCVPTLGKTSRARASDSGWAYRHYGLTAQGLLEGPCEGLQPPTSSANYVQLRLPGISHWVKIKPPRDRRLVSVYQASILGLPQLFDNRTHLFVSGLEKLSAEFDTNTCRVRMQQIPSVQKAVVRTLVLVGMRLLHLDFVGRSFQASSRGRWLIHALSDLVVHPTLPSPSRSSF